MIVNKQPRKKTKILLFGFINLNVMDGSAVFLSGFTTMLSMSPNLEIDIILANPVQRDLLIRPLTKLPNVNVISPYEEPSLTNTSPNWVDKGQMTYKEACEVIQFYWNQDEYDWFFIRGMEVAEQLLDVNSSILESTLLYVTGITHEDQTFSNKKQEKLEMLFEKSAFLLCQTDEMKQFLVGKFPNIFDFGKIITLNPMIPDTTNNFNEVFVKKDTYDKLCYTGKFDVGWNSIPIIIGFRELREQFPEMTLEIAGDKINNNNNYPQFAKDIKYLLSNTENLLWYGAVNRNEARNIIRRSDIGITWRDSSMNSSLELSTKLLEYGSLGKAVILNPTPMHKRLFGEDYPLYAETIDDFINIISTIQSDTGIYEFAARRMFEVSQNFTYSHTLKKLLPHLSKNQKEISSIFQKNGFEITDELKELSNIESLREFALISQFDKKQSSDYLCLSQVVYSIEDFKIFLIESSKKGTITDITFSNFLLVAIIRRTNVNYQENYMNNVDSSYFDEIIQRVAHYTYIRNIEEDSNKQKKTISLPDESSLIDGWIDPPPSQYSRKVNKDDLLEITKLQKEYDNLHKKYNALKKSKLGQLTVKYWNIKRRLKG